MSSTGRTPRMQPPQRSGSLLPWAGGAMLIAALGAGYLWCSARTKSAPRAAASASAGGQDESANNTADNAPANVRGPKPLSPAEQRQQEELMREMLRQAQVAAAQPIEDSGSASPVSQRTDPPPEPMPPPGLDADGGSPFNDYLKRRMDEDMMPLARECYQTARVDDPELTGKVVLFFRIVGDPRGGGLVQSARVVDDVSTITEPVFARCLADAVSTVRFGAPAQGFGETSVQYPISFSPEMLSDGG